MSIVQAVKKEARRLGFTLVGITTPKSPPHFSAYEDWLKLGRNGSMDYLEGEPPDPAEVIHGWFYLNAVPFLYSA